MRVLLALATLCAVSVAQRGRPLKPPRIYNALITSDEMLLPSQAYPAVSPVLRPAVPATHFYYSEQEVLQQAPLPSAPVGRELPLIPTNQEDLLEQVKNNKPQNTTIPDVPPPPIPGVRGGGNRPRGPAPPLPIYP